MFKVALNEYKDVDGEILLHRYENWDEANEDFMGLMKNDEFIDNIKLAPQYILTLIEITKYGVEIVHRRELLIPTQ